jgi:hypothetical protein
MREVVISRVYLAPQGSKNSMVVPHIKVQISRLSRKAKEKVTKRTRISAFDSARAFL